MNKKTARQFAFLVIFMIISACAKIGTLSGGLKDRIPPKVIETNPADGAVNFHGNRLIINFDEYVVLDNINDKFMVSPPMKKKPRVYTRGQSVRVDYEDKLRDSTTYTFYFMDAIKDLNEGNILPNYKIAVSTGAFIDSLSLTGNVYLSPGLNAPEASYVLLYSNPEDTAVVKLFPDYLTRIDETGYFRIDNIRQGRYSLYALKDDNNSKNYDRPDELFGFSDSIINITPENNFLPPEPDTVILPTTLQKKKTPPAPVRVTKTTASATAKPEEAEIPVKQGQYSILMYAPLKTKRYLANTSRSKSYKLTYILSIPPDTMAFDFQIMDVADDKYFIEKTPAHDTITVWLKDSITYSRPTLRTIVRYPFTDSLGIDIYKQDTVSMRFTAPREPKAGKKKTMLSLKNNIPPAGMKPGTDIIFKTETPLMPPDTSKIRLFELGEKKRLNLPYKFVIDSSSAERMTLEASLKEGKQYLFVADSASISDIYGEHIDSIGIKFSVREATTYSKLELDISNSGGRCIVQLMDNTEKIIAESIIAGDGKLVFSFLDKGVYRLRAISDTDGDGKWTTGDFFKKRQPESVTYFFKEIEIPEGWDANEKWDMSQKNYKPQKLRSKPKP
ncbi:MAG TPA: Ig-like domain-containing domain [Bacteroidales bacterium]|nr:Ig-like domain-containing domain [Bacteroidales bacterium]